MNKPPASSYPAKGEGRALRRARNVVKRWNRAPGGWKDYLAMPGEERREFNDAERCARYERACALLVAAALRKP